MQLNDIESDIFSKIQIPQEDLDNLKNEDSEDLLDDLGYIFIDQNNEREISEDEFLNGILLFRRDCVKEKAFVKKYVDIPKQLSEEQLSDQEIEFLNLMTSLDNELVLENYSYETILANNILRRVFVYRLALLGLLTTNQGEQIQNVTITNAINKLRNWTFISDQTQLISLTGNIPELTKLIIKRSAMSGSSFNNVLYFKNKVDNPTEREIRRQTDKKSFINGLTTYSIPASNQYTDTWKKNAVIRENISEDINQFVSRLIQIRLWMLGTYEGKLDSDLGVLSLDAFYNTLNLANKIVGNDRFQFKWLLNFKMGGYWSINVSYLIHAIFPVIYKEELQKQNGTVSGELLGVIDQASSEEDKDALYKDIQNQINEYNQEKNEVDTAGNKKKRRKKYRNNKGLFGIAKEFFKKITSSIGNFLKKALSAIKSFFNFIKNGIRTLIQEIKKAILKFKESIQFVFGNRIIETYAPNKVDLIKTTFDFDFDNVTEMSSNINSDTLEQHQKKVESSLNSTYTALNFLKKALPLVINALKGPIGWVKLGFIILKQLLKVGKEKIGLA